MRQTRQIQTECYYPFLESLASGGTDIFGVGGNGEGKIVCLHYFCFKIKVYDKLDTKYSLY